MTDSYPSDWIVKEYSPNATQPIPGLSEELKNVCAVKEIMGIRKAAIETELVKMQEQLVTVASADMNKLKNLFGGRSCEATRDIWTARLMRDMLTDVIAPRIVPPSNMGYLHISQSLVEKLDAMPHPIERAYNDGVGDAVAGRITSELRRASHSDEMGTTFAIQNGAGLLCVPVASVPLALPRTMQGPPAIRDGRSFGKIQVTTLSPLREHTQKALEDVVLCAMDLVSDAHKSITDAYSTKVYYS